MSKRQISCVLLIGLALAAVAIGGLEGSYVVPLDHAAIQYAALPVDDAVSRLQKRIDAGDLKLKFREGHGYLESILEALTVRPSSQVLVFSKTSFQATRIAPKLPRAVYFNDNVAVGWVRGGDVLEFAAVDPRQGVIFYTLDQEPTGKPHFDRQDTCLQCHQNGSTVGVPGLLVRSVYPSQSGMPVFQAGSFVTDHRSPLKERWGGWYVTGKHGAQAHMGNAIVQTREGPIAMEPNGQNVTDLRFRFDTGAYLTPHSDIVALMVLEHQTRMTNLITRVGFEARLALYDNAVMSKFLQQPEGELSESNVRRINNAAEELVKYMLFAEEARLTEPVTGVSGFAESFARQGPRDGTGRSLRELDLKTRLLRYPCSYLIYAEAFDQMPQPMKERVYQRLWQVLSGEDQGPKFASLSSVDRRSILEILRATKTGLPEYWLRP
ncbi:hypothetical protein [Paludibaculum fermentans]|uniref:Cytochrome c domain-containing protein n=1 Tax=Paludibaculum fermentans TaxID=1473598 RepID=A0A7S7SNP5_PALFE|nr:hypothetical protein [Paludibaculum fermentans]QOY90340.1 hypothetical protein IRI77_10400 [Paludibaculum fermentans]